ncbi:putative zinc protease YmxG [Clostridia bacterium]|nr:putative zinc protease YmxG [Clostridia bacterium]GHV31580.1 putative zinc protease YmxG [Clostridia bacterium]
MIEKTTLPNGVRLMTERLPYVKSASFGIWVGAGSRHETPKYAGASHALEHMAFKGTKTRAAAEIAELMDSMGGQLNAFTTKECTCFYGRAIESHLNEALGLICDIFFEPLIAEKDWQTERGVILEEIDMYEDAPEDLVSERLFAGVFRGSRLGKPILGNRRSLNALTAGDLRRYRDMKYGDVVVSIAGMYGDGHVRYLADRFGAVKPPKSDAPPPAAYFPAAVAKKKPIEQNHWCLSFPGLAVGDNRRHTLQVLSGILGGGMSSRLFQTVREREGLCYEISTFVAPHRDVGVFGVYSAMNREAERRALTMTVSTLKEMAEHGPTEAEVNRTREQLKSSAVMSLESTQNRMNHMGQSELLLGEVLRMEEMMARCDAVTREGCRDMAAQLLKFDLLGFSAVGKVDGPDEYRELFK